MSHLARFARSCIVSGPGCSVIDVAVILNPASGSAAGDATPERIVELFAAAGRTATILAAGPGGAGRRPGARGGRGRLPAGRRGRRRWNGQRRGRGASWGGNSRSACSRSGRSTISPRTWASAGARRRPCGVAAQGAVRRVDVGEVNGRVFLNNSSIGVYPRIVELRRRHGGHGRGKWIAALWASLAVLRRRPFMGVRIRTAERSWSGRRRSCSWATTSTAWWACRPRRASRSRDGQLALYVMHGVPSAEPARAGLAGALARGGAGARARAVSGDEATVETRRRAAPGGARRRGRHSAVTARYRILPAALRVLTP